MSPVVHEALALPNGARFYCCALQVNPYAYLVRHNKKLRQSDEESYNRDLVEALLAAGIEVIAVTDHYRVRTSEGLMTAARQASIAVFPGFEASTREGIHILCLFDPDTSVDLVQAKIHACGVHDDTAASPLGNLSADELLDRCGEWGMQCVAAHVTMTNGLLTSLRGQARSNLWRHSCLVAAAIPGAVEGTPIEYRHILENKDPEYKRERQIAVLNCGDISNPQDVAQSGMSCWIKMTKPTLEGLRQAFLDPDSRVRLDSHPAPEEHVEFLAIAWETAGFVRDLKLHLNENLNVLIGGRGSGKSTVIESIRYVLDLPAIGPEAAKAHQSIVTNVLRSGTKISLVVRSYRPNRRTFVVERTVGNPAAVRDADTGDVLPLKPVDIVPRASVFGQNEISELARSPEQLTELLHRFTATDSEAEGNYHAARKRLAESRRDILDCQQKLADVEESLAEMPSLEETLRRYREAGVEAKLKNRDSIIRQEGIVEAVGGALSPFRGLLNEFDSLLPMSQDLLSEEAIIDLPSKQELAS